MDVVIGIDIGGTFTDLVLQVGGTLHVHKVPSTPKDPAAGLLQGLSELREAAGVSHLPFDLIHGSTVATNAFLERTGPRTALLVTRGLEDLLVLGRQARGQLYDLSPTVPAPLVSSEATFGVPERLGADGSVVTALAPSKARALAKKVRAAGLDTAAICLLHADRDGRHEVEMGRALAAEGVEAHRSAAIWPRAGEFERASATVLNAYLSPMVRAYLDRVARESGARSLLMMKSSGGCMNLAAAGHQGLHTLLSGPAGGLAGAVSVAMEPLQSRTVPRLITFDMGGTSTDVSLIEGQPTLTEDYVIEGWPVGIAVLDIHTVGAGGGSIARVDRGGSLRVGPRSAGADPGPACYGRGDEPTVTDAHVVLGHIRQDCFLGGRMRLHGDRAHRACETLGARLGWDAIRTARGIVAVVRSNMERAIRAVSVARGHDPADFRLVSFGGAGGLHAFFLAESLGVKSVLVPRWPGALSALGMVGADQVAQGRKSWGAASNLECLDVRTLSAAFARLERRNLEELGLGGPMVRLWNTPGEKPGGDDLGPPVHQPLLELSYRGRSHVIEVPAREADEVRAEFAVRHARRHGLAFEDDVEVVGVSVRTNRAGRVLGSAARAVVGSRSPVISVRMVLDRDLESVEIHDRARLDADTPVEGPALLVDETASTLVPRGWRVRTLSNGDAVGERFQ